MRSAPSAVQSSPMRLEIHPASPGGIKDDDNKDHDASPGGIMIMIMDDDNNIMSNVMMAFTVIKRLLRNEYLKDDEQQRWRGAWIGCRQLQVFSR